MAERKDVFSAFCKPENLLRKNWLGDTYGAIVTVQGSQRNCDLTRIKLPLDEERISEAALRFGLEREEEEDFNAWLWKKIQRHVRMLNDMKNAAVASVVELYHADSFLEGDERVVYILTEPCTPFRKAVEDTTMPLAKFYGFVNKCGNLVRDVLAKSVIHGNISLGALYLTEGDRLKLGDFFFSAYIDEETDEERYKYYLPPNGTEEQAKTGETDYYTDIRSLCSLLWKMACEIPADIRTPYWTTTKKLPEEFISLLLATSEELDQPLEKFRRTISGMFRGANKAESGIIISIPRSIVDYEPVPATGPILSEIDESAFLEAISKPTWEANTEKSDGKD